MDDFAYFLAFVFLIAIVGNKLLQRRRNKFDSRTVFPKEEGWGQRNSISTPKEVSEASQVVSPDDDLVKLQSVSDPGTAHLLKGLLEVNGVPCLIRGESRYAEGAMWEQGIDLLVPMSRLADAQSLMKELERQA